MIQHGLIPDERGGGCLWVGRGSARWGDRQWKRRGAAVAGGVGKDARPGESCIRNGAGDRASGMCEGMSLPTRKSERRKGPLTGRAEERQRLISDWKR